MSEDQVRALIRKRAARYAKRARSTGVTAWGIAKGVNKGHLSEFMAGKRSPSSDVLTALGLEYRIVRALATSRSQHEGASS